MLTRGARKMKLEDSQQSGDPIPGSSGTQNLAKRNNRPAKCHTKRNVKVQQSTVAPENPAIAQPCLTSAVFANDIILGGIVDYLGVPDLKILRQTCKLLFAKVSGHPKFANNLRITISHKTINENVITGASIMWKNAKIDVGKMPVSSFPLIKRSLSHVEDLELDLPNNRHRISREASLRSIQQFSNLKSLTLGLKFFSYDIPFSAIKRKLEHLERFCISGDRRGSASEIYKVNMRSISAIGWKLKCFEFGDGFQDSFPNPVEGILVASMNTLETIKAMCNVIHLGKIEEIVFSALKSLSCKFTHEGLKLASFLRNQPELEKLHLIFENDSNIPFFVLKAIEGKSSKLQTLLLDGGRWLESFPSSNSWKFLAHSEKLKEFYISGGGHNGGPNGMGIRQPCVQHLPSAAIKSIHLEKLRSAIGWGANTISTLKRFPHLVQLKLTKCRDVLNDIVLQTICSEMTRLRVFHFGWSDDITDYGLTGERNEENTGVSLRNLKGLQDLQIYLCDNVTMDGIIKAVQFRELRVADLRFTNKVCISDSTMVELARNNPSLEHVERFLQSWPWSFFDTVRTVNPRMTRVRSTHIPRFCLESTRSRNRSPARGRPSYGVLATQDESIHPKLRVRSTSSSKSYRLILMKQADPLYGRFQFDSSDSDSNSSFSDISLSSLSD